MSGVQGNDELLGMFGKFAIVAASEVCVPSSFDLGTTRMNPSDNRGPRCELARTLLGWFVAIAHCFVGVAAWGSETPRKSGVEGSSTDPAAVEYFEKSVRPILAERCFGCHGPSKQKGGLRLDARAAILAGGATGPAVVPGNAKESLLVDAINYGETYQMPPKSKLPDAEIATLTEWVRRGAPWGVEPGRDGSSPSSKPGVAGPRGCQKAC